MPRKAGVSMVSSCRRADLFDHLKRALLRHEVHAVVTLLFLQPVDIYAHQILTLSAMTASG